MSLFVCPKCQSSHIFVQGPPVRWEFVADGPEALGYDDDPGTIPSDGVASCGDCPYSGKSEEFWTDDFMTLVLGGAGADG